MQFDFKLPNVDGRQLSFEDYPDAKGFIVIFSCNHCPYAVAYENRLIQLHEECAPKGYPVLVISSNDPVKYPQDSFENMKKRAEAKAFPFPYLFDESQSVAHAYGAMVTPHAYVLQKTEKGLRLAFQGAIDNNKDYRAPQPVKDRYVVECVDALLADPALEYTENQPVGCSIKWK
jgi:peroxiredoxin